MAVRWYAGAVVTSPTFDATRFRRLASYIRELPNGLASHAAASTKASLYVHALADKPLLPFVRDLPPEIADLVERPLLVSSWAPATHVQGVFLAIADAHELSDDAFQEWARRTQRALFTGILYRALSMIASPSALLKGAERRWDAFHRGSTLAVIDSGPGHVTARVDYPHNLYALTNLRGFAGGFAAAGELSRARGLAVRVAEKTACTATFDIRWKV